MTVESASIRNRASSRLPSLEGLSPRDRRRVKEYAGQIVNALGGHDRAELSIGMSDAIALYFRTQARERELFTRAIGATIDNAGIPPSVKATIISTFSALQAPQILDAVSRLAESDAGKTSILVNVIAIYQATSRIASARSPFDL